MSDRLPKTPKNIKIKYFYNHIVIMKKWLDDTTFFLTVLSWLWWFIILIYYVNSLASEVEFSKLILLYFLIGCFLLYYTTAMLINRTYIIANQKKNHCS